MVRLPQIIMLKKKISDAAILLMVEDCAVLLWSEL